MLDEKKIEEAAEKYGADNDCLVIGRDGRMSLKPELENAFEQGAHWAIKEFLKGLWHDAEEKPKDRDIIVEYNTNYYQVEEVDDIEEFISDWKNYTKQEGIVRWLYIDDLLPKQKGDEG